MAEENKPAYVVEYSGDGFENGVPARNLTAEEWAAVPDETQKRLLASGMYKKIKPSKKENE